MTKLLRSTTVLAGLDNHLSSLAWMTSGLSTAGTQAASCKLAEVAVSSQFERGKCTQS